MKTNGFTLVEMLIVVAIMSILMSIAAPAYRQMVATERVKDAASDLFSSLKKARSDAVVRNTNITVTANGSWASGWSTTNPAYSSVLLDQHGALNSVTVAEASSTNSVTFSSLGRITTALAFNFSSADTQAARCVAVEVTGHMKVKQCACAATC